MTPAEALEVTRIHERRRTARATASWGMRPFRAPHHTISASGARRRRLDPVVRARSRSPIDGVLFLDELPEFPRTRSRRCASRSRTGGSSIVRGQRSAVFPARFMLVAATNPCPCGYAGDGERCRCAESDHERYRRRLSGPLLDRFDLFVQVLKPTQGELSAAAVTTSAAVAQRVAEARERQARRQEVTGAASNAELDVRGLRACVRLDDVATRHLDRAYATGALSPRGRHRALRLARTLADLDARDDVGGSHLLAALGLRLDGAGQAA